ncbi:MAG: ATP-binding cassette domain-containing protein [Oscillospiraceae bacterium]|nr:ATP-binding cassette domain-containing protein [Oscillospiraceae bacterium]
MSLRVSHLVKRYGEFTAVDDLDFELSAPGVFALLGSNGAGKTTSMRVILGMLAKESGSVEWDGKPLKPASGSVGYLAEERGLYPKYKIGEQLAYFARLKGMPKSAADEAIGKWLSRLGVEEYRYKIPDQLSKGNQQKIQLACALIADPELLILDEPLSGLDPVNSDLFRAVIREQIDAGKYIIMSSHQMPVVEEFCEHIIIMHRGKTVLQGDLNNIKRGYGRVNLSVKADENIIALAEEFGLAVVKQTPNGVDFRVPSEYNARQFLRKAVDTNVNIVKFELREPTLHEIFVEKVTGVGGDSAEKIEKEAAL